MSTRALTRVLVNLLRNAAQHTPQGEIAVQARVENGHLLLSVKDTGEGIHPDRLPHIHRAWTTGADGRKSADHRQGVGLGLAIVDELVTAAGGDVHFDSTLGEGTRATVRLPMTSSTPPCEQPLRILLADDVAVNRLLAVNQLEDVGAKATAVGSGMALLEALEDSSPDVVLVDYWMPGLHGPDIVRRIKARHSSTICVVGWTSPDPKVAERFAQAGADLVVGKPLTDADIHRIQALASSRTSPRQ